MIKLILAVLCSADGYACWYLLSTKNKMVYYILLTYISYIVFVGCLINLIGWLGAIILIALLTIALISYCVLTAKEMEED